MEEAALWRAMKRQANKDLPTMVPPRPQTTLRGPPKTAPRPALEVEDPSDPECIEIDLVEEARHRVYFGFFHLDWLDVSNKTSIRKTAFNLASYTDAGRKKQYTERNLNLSQGETAGRASYLRTKDFSADRSLHTHRSDRKWQARDATLHTEVSLAMDAPHVCSLYGQPQPLATPFRDDQSYGSLRAKRLDMIDDLDADCERLKKSLRVVREKKKQKLKERELEQASRSGASHQRDRAIIPRYDQPRMFRSDGTVLYQDQLEGLDPQWSEGLREMVDPWHTEATARSFVKSHY